MKKNKHMDTEITQRVVVTRGEGGWGRGGQVRGWRGSWGTGGCYVQRFSGLTGLLLLGSILDCASLWLPAEVSVLS